MYSTQIDGETLEFGTSGLLYRSNKLMYDRGTKTLWNQFIGEPAVGPLVGSGIKLEVLPVVVTTWGEWVAAHPNTTVLDLETGLYPPREYRSEGEPGSIYFDYRTRPDTMFPAWKSSDLLAANGRVLGLRINGQARAYPLPVFEQAPVINDSLGGENLVVVSDDSGGARAFLRGPHRFTAGENLPGKPGVGILIDETGRRWRVEEQALSPLGHLSGTLPRLPSHNAYWFGWYAFYPDTGVYTGSAPAP